MTTPSTASAATRIACLQLAPELGDLAGNRRLVAAAVEDAVHHGAQVVVLPELVTSGYMFRSVAEARAVAIGADSDIFVEWARIAAVGDAVVIGGFCETADDGGVFNSAAVVTSDGVQAVYRKLHLWDNEKAVFTPGSTFPPVVDTVHGRIGVVVCYDLEFPELTRAMALAGTDLLAVPTNWPLVFRPAGERPPEVQVAIAAARVNRMAIACCDRTGVERGQEWTAGSTVIDSDGWVVATATGETSSAVADVDLTRGRDKAITARADLFADRRPEFYRSLG